MNINLFVMKRMALLLTLSLVLSIAYGQRSVDALFKNYSGKDGFVTLTINGDLLNVFTSCEDKFWPGNITEVRMLVQEDKSKNNLNFYDYVINDIDLKDYEEFMRVKESDQDLRMLVKIKDDMFREFLLIGGGEDNLLIQVKGNMTFNEARKFSSNFKHKQDAKLKASRN